MQREDLKEFLGWFLINLVAFVNSCFIGFLFFLCLLISYMFILGFQSLVLTD